MDCFDFDGAVCVYRRSGTDWSGGLPPKQTLSLSSSGAGKIRLSKTCADVGVTSKFAGVLATKLMALTGFGDFVQSCF